MSSTLQRTAVVQGEWDDAAKPQSAGRDEVWPIAVLQWPAEAGRAEQLTRERRLRLYVVAPGHEPPIDWDGLSDWIRGPAEANDIYARVEALQRRVAVTPATGSGVLLDRDGILWRAEKGWVALTPIEETMVKILLERPSTVVSRKELLVSTGAPSDSTRVLDARLCRLRRRISPLGVNIINVRRRGYLMQIEAD